MLDIFIKARINHYLELNTEIQDIFCVLLVSSNLVINLSSSLPFSLYLLLIIALLYLLNDGKRSLFS